MTRRPRVLVLSPYPTVPDHIGGKVRIVQLARHVTSQGFDVTLVEPFAPGRYRPPSDTDRVAIHRVKYPFVLPFLLTDKPFPYLYLVSLHPGYGWLLNRYLSQFDIYQFEHVSFADLVSRLPAGKPIIYDAHNVEYDYVSSESQAGWVRQIASSRIFDLEKELVNRSTRIITCSSEDRQRLASLYGVATSKIDVIPNGIREISKTDAVNAVDLPEFSGTLVQFKRRVLFSGSNVEHNRRAVRFILQDLAPALSQDCAFIVKGPCGVRFRQHGLANVFIDATPGSIRPLASISTVAINPVAQGSGTNLKVLDYLAHGLPVITTSFGMRGYEDLAHLVTVCPLDAFPAALGAAHRLAPTVVEDLRPYLWSNVATRLARIYAAVLGGGGSRGGSRTEPSPVELPLQLHLGLPEEAPGL